jgi:hypothetical protein
VLGKPRSLDRNEKRQLGASAHSQMKIDPIWYSQRTVIMPAVFARFNAEEGWQVLSIRMIFPMNPSLKRTQLRMIQLLAGGYQKLAREYRRKGMRMLKLRHRQSLPEMTAPPFDPFRRLKNLEKAQTRVRLQLSNPNLLDIHRPEVLRRLSSIADEIAQLRIATSPIKPPARETR